MDFENKMIKLIILQVRHHKKILRRAWSPIATDYTSDGQVTCLNGDRVNRKHMFSAKKNKVSRNEKKNQSKSKKICPPEGFSEI